MKPTEILVDAERVAADAIQLRRRIHRHPEIGLALPRTQAAVLEALDGLGLETRAGQRTTSEVAVRATPCLAIPTSVGPFPNRMASDSFVLRE